jgi:hypothetical protein
LASQTPRVCGISLAAPIRCWLCPRQRRIPHALVPVFWGPALRRPGRSRPRPFPTSYGVGVYQTLVHELLEAAVRRAA